MPEWAAAPVRLPGSALSELGLPAPAMRATSVLVIEVERVG
jgi:alpha-galactosidase